MLSYLAQWNTQVIHHMTLTILNLENTQMGVTCIYIVRSSLYKRLFYCSKQSSSDSNVFYNTLWTYEQVGPDRTSKEADSSSGFSPSSERIFSVTSRVWLAGREAHGTTIIRAWPGKRVVLQESVPYLSSYFRFINQNNYKKYTRIEKKRPYFSTRQYYPYENILTNKEEMTSFT